MATSTLDDAAIQLANSLTVEAVPAKLRCASCNKLAINAVKLPCCDQSICESCSHHLPETCPICSHSPIAAEDCKPDKKLRMTIKAFVKNEEKKRSKESEPPKPEPVLTEQPVEAPAVASELNGAPEQGKHGATPVDPAAAEEAPSGVVTSTEEVPAQPDVQREEEDEEDDEDDIVITTERPETEAREEQPQQASGEDNQQDQGNYGEQYEKNQVNGQQQDFGSFDQSQQQSFNSNNMDFNAMAGFNPMMAMQSGMMGNFGMAMPNMMGKYRGRRNDTPNFARSRLSRGALQGMPGMNMNMPMDPSMMFGAGFGDMSMMNMMGGMGNFGGMNGGAGGGFGFGPQGMNGAGGGVGYNASPAQSFGNNMHQQNFHHHNRGYGGPPNRGFGGRGGYGRGGNRGWNNGPGYNGRGRGGWQHQGYAHTQQQQGYMQQNSFQQQQQQQNLSGNDSETPQPGARRGSPSYEPMKGPDDAAPASKDGSVQPRQTDAEDGGEVTNDAVEDVGTTNHTAENEAEQDVDGGDGDIVVNGTANESASMDISADPSAAAAVNDEGTKADAGQEGTPRPAEQDQYAARNGTYRNSRGRSTGAYGYVATAIGGEPEVVEAPPINAPTGPKAMRQGLPNSGWYSRPQNQQAVVAKPATPSVEGSKHRERSASRERRKSRHDDYLSDEETDRDRERRKRKERERERDRKYDDSAKSSKPRSRSESPRSDDHGSSRRKRRDDGLSSRSRRDRDRSRDKHRSSRRHRSRSAEKETSSVNGEGYESSRRKSKSSRYDDREKERDRDREHKYSSSRRSSKYGDDFDDDSSRRHSRHKDSSKTKESSSRTTGAVLEEPNDEIGFKIKGTKSAALGLGMGMGPPKAKSSDPYAEEREKMKRARLDRENSLRSGGQSLGKRMSRDGEEGGQVAAGGDGGGKKVKRRNMSVKYEDEIEMADAHGGSGGRERRRHR